MTVHMLASCTVVLLVTPMVLVGAVPLVFVYLRVQRLYVATNRELKRLDSLAFSPIFSHLSESLQVCPGTVPCLYLQRLMFLHVACFLAEVAGSRRMFVCSSMDGPVRAIPAIAAEEPRTNNDDTLQGLETIRAFREQEAFQLRCQQLIDASSRAWWPIQACYLAYLWIASP